MMYSKLMHEYSGNADISAFFDKQWTIDRTEENRKEQSSLDQQLTEKRNQALKEEVIHGTLNVIFSIALRFILPHSKCRSGSA